METNINEIEVNGIEYVRKDSVSSSGPVTNVDGLPYVIIRSRDSGCHAGFVSEGSGTTAVTLVNARRLYYWDGASTLSQLAMEGVSKPDKCKFPTAVNKIIVNGVCEEISGTDKARKSIEGVKIWKS